MTRKTTKADELARLKFAEEAARAFKIDPKLGSYGAVEAGGYLALRWGLGDDCVMVVKLDENDEPVNFQELVREV
jgi:hypothetical protein